MIKAIELVVVVTLMVFSFVIGVKYSDNVKSHAGWLFETKEEEVDLPDLTNESGVESITVYDNGAVDNGEQMPQEASENATTVNTDVSVTEVKTEAAPAPATTNNVEVAPAKAKNAKPAAKQ